MSSITVKCVRSDDSEKFCPGLHYDAVKYKNGRVKVFNSKGLAAFTDQHGVIGCKVTSSDGRVSRGYIFFEEVKL